MSTSGRPADCPVCHSAGAVVNGWCQLCEAVFDDDPDGAVDLPSAALSDTPGIPLRFADVIEELQRVGSLVSNADGALELEAACGRLQDLLQPLRVPFLMEVVVGPNTQEPASALTQPNLPVT